MTSSTNRKTLNNYKKQFIRALFCCALGMATKNTHAMQTLKTKYLTNYKQQIKLITQLEQLERLEKPCLKAKIENDIDELTYKNLFLVNKIGFEELGRMHKQIRKMYAQVNA